MSQQLEAANKKPRFGPKLGTQAWWVERIKAEHQEPFKYTSCWNHISEYHLARLRALAELDYQVLGKVLEGAPDHKLHEPGKVRDYPIKV